MVLISCFKVIFKVKSSILLKVKNVKIYVLTNIKGNTCNICFWCDFD